MSRSRRKRRQWVGWQGGREGIGISDSSISKQLDIECIYHLYIKCGALSSITVNVFHILAHTYSPPSLTPSFLPLMDSFKMKSPPAPPPPKTPPSRGTTYIQSKVEIFFRFLLLSPNIPLLLASDCIGIFILFDDFFFVYVCVCVLIPSSIFYIHLFIWLLLFFLYIDINIQFGTRPIYYRNFKHFSPPSSAPPP